MKYSALFILITLGIIVGGVFWWLSTKSYPIKNMPTKPLQELTVIAVGDSLVEGQGSTAGNDFVSLVSKRLRVPIQNYGVSGDTSSQVLARMDDVTEEKPDLVILLVGGNDALRKTSKETTFKNIEAIITSLQATGSAVVLVGIQGGLVGNGYQKEFERLAEKTGSLFVPDILDGMIGNPELMSDAVHPNNAGYKVIAGKVSLVIENAFKK